MDDVQTAGIEGVSTEASELDNSAAVPRERVTELIKREKEAAYRKAQREYQAQLDAVKTGQTQQMGGMTESTPFDKEALYKEFRSQLENEFKQSQEDAQRQQYEKYVSEQANTYLSKMNAAGPDLADDFKEMTAKFKPEAFQEVFYLANSLENTPQIVYDLMQNPSKLTHLDYLAKRDPDLAYSELQALSKSIQMNQQAKENLQLPDAPLSRQKPSIAAGQDSGVMTLRDLKASPSLRG